jgi:hypothetical protein
MRHFSIEGKAINIHNGLTRPQSNAIAIHKGDVREDEVALSSDGIDAPASGIIEDAIGEFDGCVATACDDNQWVSA